MKKLVSIIGFASCMLMAGDLTVGGSIISSDSWRGLQFSDNPVFQMELNYSINDFSIIAWGNMEISDQNNSFLEMNRRDITFDYTKSTRRFSFSTGVTAYSYPGYDLDSTLEAYLGLSYEHFLNPTIMVYQDIKEVEGAYAQLGFFPSFPIFQNRFSSGLESSFVLGFGSNKFKMGYFDMGSSEVDHGGNGNHGDGNHNGNHGGNHGNINAASSGLLQYTVSLTYPVQLQKGRLELSTYYIEYLDDEIHSPLFQGDQRFLIFEISYRILL